MIQPPVDPSDVSDLPPLPNFAMTKDGVQYRPLESDWYLQSINGKYTFKFSRLKLLSARIVHCLRLLIIWHLEKNSFSHAKNIFYAFEVFYRIQISSQEKTFSVISLGQIMSYRVTLDYDTEWKMGMLRILFTDMAELGYGICDADTLRFLRTAEFAGNPKGNDARTRNPQTGAFDEVELQAMQAAVNTAFAAGKISLYDFALTWLFLSYGSRPISFAALKECDLIVSVGQDGSHTYALRVPRAKQHGGSIRGEFKVRYCSKQVGELLEVVIENNRKMRDARGQQQDIDWPMFMAAVNSGIPGLEYHVSSSSISANAASIFKGILPFKTNAKRFRITLPTRAADEGASIYDVAEILDHSDTQNVAVYFEAGPAQAERLDRHMAMELAPIAQAFAGTLIDSEREGLGPRGRKSLIFDRSLKDNITEPLGDCGQMSFCGLTVPYSCYTCIHFQPFIDGPHEEFMDSLLSDRDRMIDADYSPKIIDIKKRTILAAAMVVKLCREARGLGKGTLA